MSAAIDREGRGAEAVLRDAGVVVSGGASGLGEATVRRLHALGAHVVIADRSVAPARAIAQELGARARATPCDVTQPEEVAAAVSLAEQAPRGLRLAVACAGIGFEGQLVGQAGVPHPLEDFERHVNVNLVGVFNVVRLAVASMHRNERDLDGERGLIVLAGSMNAYEAGAGEVQYSASKGGVHSLTLPAARELGPYGIRVNTIAPGPFATGMMGNQADELQEHYARAMAFPKRFGRPAEFASMVEQIVVNQMINGSIIRIDGAGRYG